MRLWFEWCFLTNLAWHFQEILTGLPPKEGWTIKVVSNLKSATDFVSFDIHYSIFTAYWGAKTRGDYKYENLKIRWGVFLVLSGKASIFSQRMSAGDICWPGTAAGDCQTMCCSNPGPVQLSLVLHLHFQEVHCLFEQGLFSVFSNAPDQWSLKPGLHATCKETFLVVIPGYEDLLMVAYKCSHKNGNFLSHLQIIL